MTKNDERINELFDELVPACGKADTVAGEIIRAISRIGYRWYNDGDMLGVGYGKETCNPAGHYLASKVDRQTELRILHMMYISSMHQFRFFAEDLYEKNLEAIKGRVLDFLDAHPELKETKNEEDMFSYREPLDYLGEEW